METATLNTLDFSVLKTEVNEIHSSGLGNITFLLALSECKVTVPNGRSYTSTLMAPSGEPLIELSLPEVSTLEEVENLLKSLSSFVQYARKLSGFASKGRAPGSGLGEVKTKTYAIATSEGVAILSAPSKEKALKAFDSKGVLSVTELPRSKTVLLQSPQKIEIIIDPQTQDSNEPQEEAQPLAA